MTGFFADWRVPHADPLAEFALGLDRAIPGTLPDRIEHASRVAAMRAWWSRASAPTLPSFGRTSTSRDRTTCRPK